MSDRRPRRTWPPGPKGADKPPVLERGSVEAARSEADLNAIGMPRVSGVSGSSSSSSEKRQKSGTRTRTLEVRRRRRVRKYLDAAFSRESKCTTFLEDQAVTTKVLRTYDKEVELFKHFLEQNGLTNNQDMDDCIAQYLNYLFWNGEQPFSGEKFLAGWMRRQPGELET